MVTFLLLTCSFALGSLAYWGVLGLLGKISREYREVRLKGIVLNAWEGRERDGTWGHWGAVAGEWLAPLLGWKPLGVYVLTLRDLARRTGCPALPVTQILGQQALFGVLGALTFSFLSMGLHGILVGSFLGALLPFLRLRDRALRREKEVLRELPIALDFLALCSEAGLPLEMGMEQFEKSGGAGPLREEFARILTEARSGASRKGALQAASNRLDLTDFSLFASSLIQAEKFGTGISKTLRQLSLSIRDQQVQRAEKAVQELPVKLLLPLVLCIVPVTFLVIFGPVVIQFLRS